MKFNCFFYQTLLISGLVWLFACESKSSKQQIAVNPPLKLSKAEAYYYAIDSALQTLHLRPASPQPGEWLAEHEEPGQTFMEYVHTQPPADTLRKTIYILPIGDFTASQRQVLTKTADYLALFYQMKIKMLADLPLAQISATAKRQNPITNQQQIHTIYVLDKILKPQITRNAACLIAFTAEDLYPADDWNFVFGQASLRERVGIWSMHRLGNPAESTAAYQACLLRTIKTATHEIGHIFGLWHCIEYECEMAGSNHLTEADNKPSWFCPTCLAKVGWHLRLDIIRQQTDLQSFWQKNDFPKIAHFYQEAKKKLKASKSFSQP